jgi:hypothetical protein
MININIGIVSCFHLFQSINMPSATRDIRIEPIDHGTKSNVDVRNTHRVTADAMY